MHAHTHNARHTPYSKTKGCLEVREEISCWKSVGPHRNVSARIKVDGAKTWNTATKNVRAVIYCETDADLMWIREQFLKHIGSENIIL